MRFNFSVYGVFLVIAGAWAWWASLPRQDGNAEVERWISIAPASVSEVTVTGKDEQVAIKLDSAGKHYWADYSHQTPAPTPAPTPVADPKAKPTPTPPATPVAAAVKEDERFLVSDKLTETLDTFNPLQVLRVVGKVDNAALNEFGLKDPEGSLRIVEKNGTAHDFRIGKKAFGTQNVYLMDVSKNAVILVDGGPVDSLRRARARLYERRLTATSFDDLSNIEVTVPGSDKAQPKTKKMRALKKDDKGEVQWSDDVDKGDAKPSYKTWLGKVERLRTVSYAKPEDEASIKTAKVLFEIVLYAKGAVVDKLVFKKTTNDAAIKMPEIGKNGAPAADESKDTYWVSSTFLDTHAKLNAGRVDPVEKDLGSVVP